MFLPSFVLWFYFSAVLKVWCSPLDSSPLILAVLLLPKSSVICTTFCVLYFYSISLLIEPGFHPSGQCSTHRKQSLDFWACSVIEYSIFFLLIVYLVALCSLGFVHNILQGGFWFTSKLSWIPFPWLRIETCIICAAAQNFADSSSSAHPWTPRTLQTMFSIADLSIFCLSLSSFNLLLIMNFRFFFYNSSFFSMR